MGYLDNAGLTRVWGKIVAALSGKLDATGNAYRTASIPFAQVDTTSTSTVYTATVPGITELRSGVCAYIRNGVVTSASGYTLNVNGLGAKPCYSSMAAATRSTTVFNANYTFLFVFNEERVSGGCWDIYYGYYSDANSIGYQLRTNSTTMPVTDKFYRYRLLFTSADRAHIVPANTSTSTNATASRTVNQRPIDPFGSIVYYGHTTAINSGANPTASYFWTQYNINLGYSFNRTGAALTLTNHAPVYIKCAPQSDGSAIIDPDTPYVQSLPSAEDGKIYIFIGIASGAETVELVPEHPVYCYRNGQIRLWTGNEENELPDFTAADEGKILGIENGVLAWVEQTGGSGEIIYFDDRNDDVIGYLTASETYTAENRSTVSVISQYASASTEDQDAPKPFMGHYNLFPGVDNNVEGFVVRTFGEPPRMLKLGNVWNVRDCGGWSCDGGRVKYGLLFRGARLENATADDLSLLASVGIKLDLDIRDTANASGATRIPGASYRNIPLTRDYAAMIQNETANAVAACVAAMESVVDGKPVYIHCASGADRTGTICALLEAVLGVPDRDIDRDFELTCFADVENLTGHTRVGGAWTGLWSALDLGQGSAKMNVVKFLRDNGVTTALINSFRRAVIDGNPSDVDIPTFRITNNLTNCTTSNAVASVDGGSAYSATITPNSGYSITILNVTMGGTDITATAVSGNTVTISSVTGAVVITAFAEAQTSYTNIVRQAQEVGSTAVYNGVGYKNGYYISSGNDSANAADCAIGCIPYEIIMNGTQPTDVLYIKGYSGSVNASHTRLNLRKTDKSSGTEYNGFLQGAAVFDVETLGAGYYKLTPKANLHHAFNFDVGYLRFSFAGTDGANIIITKNEPIE